MATGGTIPTNRTQSVTFYNTTAIIEREKNIYYVPRFSKLAGLTQNTEVRQAYLTAFNGVCSSSSDYSNIAIGGWSPQDRTLVVQGNIDDFRLVTDVGKCLNYFIISRTITTGSGESEVSKTYYYGFFITGVQQAGGSSIRITCEPDDFTNVFYLHNTHKLTTAEISGDYEPFNENMKNCYVNRQHYNRVKYGAGKKYVSGDYDLTINEHYTDSVIVYQSEAGEVLSNLDYDFHIIEGYSPALSCSLSMTERLGIYYVVFVVNAVSPVTIGYELTVHIECSFDSSKAELQPDNEKIFLNQEESFRFKYQYRDLKYPLCPYTLPNNFTDEEINSIEATDNFNNLSDSLKSKIILSCVAFQVLETKTHEGIGKMYYRLTAEGQYEEYDNYYGNYVEGCSKPNYILATPFLHIPRVFKKYESAINQFSFMSKIYGRFLRGSGVSGPSFIDIASVINNNAMADYALSCYLTKDICLPPEYISVKLSSPYLIYINMIFDSDIHHDSDTGVYLQSFYQNITYSSDSTKGTFITVDNTYNPTQVSSSGVYPLIALNNIYSKEIKLKVKHNIRDVINNYYEPSLDEQPYNFYSLSNYSFELPFDKNRYYVGKINYINILYTVMHNNGLKISLSPIYSVEEKETIYFNEGMTYTLTPFFILASDSYMRYYYENLSQMKNQFAVNNFNRGIDLAQHFAVSGPNAVGYKTGNKALSLDGASGALIGGTALLETANQVMQMVDEGIDWGQSHHVIEMNQKALLADVGRKPDNVKQAGSDVYTDLITGEYSMFLNHYTIDEVSYNSIAKLLERTGYQVNLYDSLNVVDRVGWNFIKLNGFDFNPSLEIMTSQENSIRAIFSSGVTLLHDKSFLTSGHNYETILEGGE